MSPQSTGELGSLELGFVVGRENIEVLITFEMLNNVGLAQGVGREEDIGFLFARKHLCVIGDCCLKCCC